MFEKLVCLLVVLTSVFTLVLYYFSYHGPEIQRNPSEYETLQSYQNVSAENSFVFNDSALQRNFRLDLGRDVFVYLHIQKTGGTTFGRHLVRDLRVTHPCICHRRRRRCDCKNASNRHWIFSRYSTGWVCGLHADWTELHECVNGMLNRMEKTRRHRRYLYITMLRSPIQRYLSEWKHVQRGSSWASAKLQCNGRHASVKDVPFCYRGENWTLVSLENFTSCPHNLAHDRQTRMLANLSLVGCYNRSAVSPPHRRLQLLLESAKQNLRNMAYFGLVEHQSASQFLFERTFNVNFTRDFVQHHNTHASRVEISPQMQRRVEDRNSLDLQLYRYAESLFFARLNYVCGSNYISDLSQCVKMA